MTTVQFEATLIRINNLFIVRLPEEISSLLPSRGMVMADITFQSKTTLTALEPDGKSSHWFSLTASECIDWNIKAGDTLSLTLSPSTDWSEPEVPEDLYLQLLQWDVLSQWNALTVKSRWEWIRFIRYTENETTRQKRIQKTCSMLSSGKKRPCCFDSSRCTNPQVSKSGILDYPL